jgi:hypothetical protein
MRARSLLYFLFGVALLVFAYRAFIGAVFFAWKTTVPVPTGHHARTRLPTEEESQAFGRMSQYLLGGTALLVLASGGSFWLCGREWRRRSRFR